MEENKLFMNGAEVVLKNPGTEGLKDFLILAKSLSKMPSDKKDLNIFDYLDDRAMDSAINLVNITLKKTYGEELSEDIDAWAGKNFISILPVVVDMCSPDNNNIESVKKEEHLKKLKQVS